MKNVFALIKRLHVFLLFLALQVVALIMVFESMFYHRATMLNAASDAVGNVYKQRAWLSEYLRLGEINDQLSLQNSLLRTQLENNYINIDTVTHNVNDTLLLQRYRYHTAKVVNNSLNRESNYITLDKGWSSGITDQMGVISNGALVGFVVNVSEHFSVAMPILHRSFQTSVRMKRSMDLGQLQWLTGDPDIANVEDLPKHVQVAVGDTVVTSGFSKYFPPNLPVGYVTEVTDNADENEFHIKIRLAAEFRKLSHVELIENLMITEQQQLEQQAEERYGTDDH
jgi:rod shape-determining protein MreC